MRTIFSALINALIIYRGNRAYFYLLVFPKKKTPEHFQHPLADFERAAPPVLMYKFIFRKNRREDWPSAGGPLLECESARMILKSAFH
jgi:hypothetical protein